MVETLQQFAAVTGIYTVMTLPWAWPIAEMLHFIGLSLLLGTVGLFDLRMLGFVRGLSLSALHRLVPLGIAGYCINLITGTMFLVSFPGQYVYNPAFQTKIAFMLAAGVNLIFFYATTYRHTQGVGEGQSAPAQARVMGAISLACWLVVISGGRLITFFRPPFFWCFWC